jgi:hypothetical protein
MERERYAKPQVGGSESFLTRRNLVHRAAWAVAAAAFPGSAKLTAPDGGPGGAANISPVMLKLSVLDVIAGLVVLDRVGLGGSSGNRRHVFLCETSGEQCRNRSVCLGRTEPDSNKSARHF